MTREAIVLETSAGTALVRTMDTGECGSCAARHACMSLSAGGREGCSFTADNDAGASSGDTVLLELRPSMSLAMTALTFIVPVLFLAAGYFVAAGAGEAAGAAGAGAGLLTGLAVSLLAGRAAGVRDNCRMRIVRIISQAGVPGNGSAEPGRPKGSAE